MCEKQNTYGNIDGLGSIVPASALPIQSRLLTPASEWGIEGARLDGGLLAGGEWMGGGGEGGSVVGTFVWWCGEE